MNALVLGAPAKEATLSRPANRRPVNINRLLLIALLFSLTAAAQAKTKITTQALSKSGPTWEFTYKYPQVQVPGALMGVNAEMRDFNRRMQQDAKDSLADFQAQIADWQIMERGAPKSGREVSYFVMSSEAIISVKFEQFQMMSGAAHPVTTVITRNFLEGHFVQLHELFGKGSGYLTVVSGLVEADLKRQAAEGKFELSPEGYAPKPENFKAFGITKGGLKIFLQRDQVAAGYVGNLTCLIPWASLESILKPGLMELVAR